MTSIDMNHDDAAAGESTLLAPGSGRSSAAGSSDFVQTETLSEAEPPALLTPPAIAGLSTPNPVVGETATAVAATWATPPVARSYSFYRGTTLVASSPTFTLTDVEAANTTRDTITVTETATFANGSIGSATSPATAMPRRTFPTCAYNIGRLTKSGWGSVPLTNLSLRLLGQGADLPNNWTMVVTGGDSSHWTLTPLNTPRPSGAGDSADLSSGTYTFTATATYSDGLPDEMQEITITTTVDVATIGQSDNWDQVASLYLGAFSGKTLELAAGSQYTTRKQMKAWAFTSTTILRYADPARIVPPTSFEWLSCANMQCDDLVIPDSSASGINARFYFARNGSSLVDNTGITLNRPQYLGSLTNIGGTAHIGIVLQRCDSTVIINDPVIEYVASVVKHGTCPAPGPIINRLNARKFYDNGIEAFADSPNLQTYDTLIHSPIRINTTTHVDLGQFDDPIVGPGTVKHCRMMLLTGFPGMLTQGYFGGSQSNGTTGNALTLMINGLVYWGCAGGGLTQNSAAGSVIAHAGLYFLDTDQMSPQSVDQIPSHTAPIPTVVLQGTAHTGTNVIRDSIIHGALNIAGSAVGTWTSTNNAVLNATANVPSTYSGLYAALSEPKIRAFASNLDNLTYAQIRNGVVDLLTPLAGVDKGPFTSATWAQ
ncbi:MAG: hypothetical protein ABW023_02500 [Sphingomonas sp.]